jgi:hypothetical protein
MVIPKLDLFSLPVRARQRSQEPSAKTRSARLAQAKLFAELARRTERPFDALPEADVSVALKVLWKEAAFWALSALDNGARSTDELRMALDETPPELLRGRVAGAEWLQAAKIEIGRAPNEMTGDGVPFDPSVATLSAFAMALIHHLEEPAENRARARLLGAFRRIGIAVVALGIVTTGYVALWDRWRPAIEGKRTTSSVYGKCDAGECGSATFHTAEENQPWVTYDLGGERELHRIDIENRSDCCFARAVPLIVETKSDSSDWKEQGRAERAFATWSTMLRGNARYVRLRVDRKSILHLASVTIR